MVVSFLRVYFSLCSAFLGLQALQQVLASPNTGYFMEIKDPNLKDDDGGRCVRKVGLLFSLVFTGSVLSQ